MINYKNSRTKLLSLLSGGIDSPVATYLMLQRGAYVEAVYFYNGPYSDDNTKNKVLELVKQIRSKADTELKLHVVPHGINQQSFASNCDCHLNCILCRRMMLRLAEQLAREIQANALVTGESLGQVASQTLQNLYVESQAIEIPVIRPLIGLDKLEIMAVAKEIGTYDISIKPGQCCTAVPKKPATRARLERILHEEGKVDIATLMNDSLKNVETF